MRILKFNKCICVLLLVILLMLLFLLKSWARNSEIEDLLLREYADRLLAERRMLACITLQLETLNSEGSLVSGIPTTASRTDPKNRNSTITQTFSLEFRWKNTTENFEPSVRKAIDLEVIRGTPVNLRVARLVFENDDTIKVIKVDFQYDFRADEYLNKIRPYLSIQERLRGIFG